MSEYRALLGQLARPRVVGTPGHSSAREILARELTARGLVVLEHRFPAAPRFPLHGVRAAEGINLIAVRPRQRVTTWLTAHYDSKGQPLSMAGRLALVAASAVAVVGGGVATFALTVSVWWWLPAVLLAGLFLALNTVTERSPGAVDNATGVITVLTVLDLLDRNTSVGVILLDAEELGLVGARALVRDRANLIGGTAVINFDGIDDRGGAIAFEHRAGPLTRRLAERLGVRTQRRLPVVVDGLVLAGVSRECLTIMKGDWGTTRLVHTLRDAPERLTLEGVQGVAQAVASVLKPAS